LNKFDVHVRDIMSMISANIFFLCYVLGNSIVPYTLHYTTSARVFDSGMVRHRPLKIRTDGSRACFCELGSIDSFGFLL